MKRINLSERSYMLYSELLDSVKPEFDDLWQKHPDEKGKVLIYGKYRKTPRWHMSYLKSYNFSGQTLKTEPIPTEVQKLLDHINEKRDIKYNQVLINWYLDGTHYIGPHSDDERQLVPGSSIYSLSLGATRKFRIRDKKTNKIVKDFELSDGTVVVMCGAMQKEFKHEIVKIQGAKSKKVGKRINITFRCFKE
jgi:alkylated DNA repair dioxygenase AlkB